MSYNFMSNISNLSNISTGNEAYQQINIGDKINFIDKNYIKHNASFLMIRAQSDNDLLIDLQPSGYCVYIPGGEMWSVDSIGEIESIVIKNIYNPETKEPISQSGYLQWMMGYK